MSNLSNDASLPENPADENDSGTSPKVMLTTIVLLIAGLFLTGFMMLHYARQQSAPLAETAMNQQQGTGGLTIQKASSLLKTLTPSEQSDAKATAETKTKTAEKSSGFNQLFQDREDHVRWPKLKLTGFGTASDGSGGFAIINGHQYHEGQFINGKVRLLEVRKHDVLVELNGSTQTLTVNIAD
ncbi:general secretion pathway protein GspB [Pontiellaceae bacterium B12227]|nr:general secretion pathway protein GspB [Pontiellaceae bacterium B12227]